LIDVGYIYKTEIIDAEHVYAYIFLLFYEKEITIIYNLVYSKALLMVT
jgi:hypothetical protein